MSKIQSGTVEGLTPAEIVAALDRYVIGQDKAKRAVAVAVRNRARRRALEPELREEVAPKNILMVGPTGVGKTEIARRLATLVGAPFLKVEATKYTEVGYVGRDVESMIRDLAAIAVAMVKREQQAAVRRKAEELAEEALLDLLLPPGAPSGDGKPADGDGLSRTRERFREKLRAGEFDEREVEFEVASGAAGAVDGFPGTGIEELDVQFQSLVSNLFQGKKRRRRVKIGEARRLLIQQESEKLIDMDRIMQEAISRAENGGIVFIDEIDKIAGREGGHGPDVSREGVQRDILPIIEGTTVNTRFGPVRTDHILFIAAGAFHVRRPEELIPELQGRFPIRVELTPLAREDLKKILTRPKNALTVQYQALLAVEGVRIVFETAAIDEIARVAEELNRTAENIGARRLHTIMEALLEDVLFSAPDRSEREVRVTRQYVRETLHPAGARHDAAAYIL